MKNQLQTKKNYCMNLTNEMQKLLNLQDYYNDLALKAKNPDEKKKYNNMAFEVMKEKQKLRQQLIFQTMKKC